MTYRIYFTTGQSIVLEKEVLFAIDFYDYMHTGGEIYINPQYITHITLEKETDVQTGIASTPTPDDLRTQTRKDKEELLRDPKMIIKRATEKSDEN